MTGDSSSSATAAQEEVDKRVAQLLDSEDSDLVWDLRTMNHGRPESYTLFLNECQRYIESTLETAVDERRHGDVDEGRDVITHLAAALSVRDFHDQVSARCPPGTPIPSVQWLRYQFWPQKPMARTAGLYKGNLSLKFMVQPRQFRASHPDAHYASTLFRYLREFAVRYHEHTTFVCQDDKHTIKVGEPGCPVAAVERGKAVLVGVDQKLVVSDHDFTKFSLTPSVNLEVKLPDSIEGSFYRGKVHVGVKDSVFQPSSGARHAAELAEVLKSSENINPILLLYTDGGPDHRLTFLSCQLALLALFLELDLDMLCAVRTPPYNSWKNPVERIMPILNIALQGVGMMRNTTDFEPQIKTANNMKQVRQLVEENPGFEEAVIDSMERPKALLTSLLSRLQLKDEQFHVFQAAPKDTVSSLLEKVKKIDPTLRPESTTKVQVAGCAAFQKFLSTHCVIRHYMFSIRKCGEESCEVCQERRLPEEIFSALHHLPDPVPSGEKYKSFDELYGEDTSEKHRPSASIAAHSHHGLPFFACEECRENHSVYGMQQATSAVCSPPHLKGAGSRARQSTGAP